MEKEKIIKNFNMSILDIFIIIIVSFMLGYFLNASFQESFKIQDNCLSCNKVYGDKNNYDVINITKVSDRIFKNCNSGFIVKHDDGYKIFNVINKDGWEKREYIDLEECYYKE